MALSPVPRQDTLPAATDTGMAAQLRRLSQSASQFADQPALRRALPSLILVGATALILLAWVALRDTPRSTLYPGMAEAEKARVIETLSGSGIEARVDTTSGEITVPATDYHRARLALAAQGLPQSVPDGDRVLTDLPMGASRALETARLRQAQELDLARSIAEIASVQGARVHLALPEKSAFLRDSHAPRASVFLALAAGRVMSPGQVEAIVHLVSSSVPGLAQSDVTVVDQTGRLLSRGDEDEAGRLSERQLRHRVEVETLMRRRIEALLTPVVGIGNLSVEVTAALDFTRVETTEERVDPQGNALRSEQMTDTISRDAPAGGIPGAVANTPPIEADLTPAAPNDNGNGADADIDPDNTIRNRSTGTTRNYEISRTIANTQNEIGRITRVSAAIVIRAPTPTTATGSDTPAGGLDPALLADLQRLTETVIGYDATRGDSVTILAQPFALPETYPDSPGLNLDWLPAALREFGLIAVLAIVGLGVLRPLLLRLTQSGVNGTTAPPLYPRDEMAAITGMSETDRRHRDLASSVLGGRATRAEKQAILRNLVAEDPVRIASVLHRMMRSDLDQSR